VSFPGAFPSLVSTRTFAGILLLDGAKTTAKQHCTETSVYFPSRSCRLSQSLASANPDCLKVNQTRILAN
jgi:hypothetical protein